MTIDPQGVAPSALPGVRYGTVARHGDSRGAFRELWRAGSFPDVTFVQANLSTSSAGVVRGLHLHQHQDDLWVVGEGRAFVALVDVRPALDADGPPVVETRELDADSWIYIPTGVAHGFLAIEPLQLIYLVTNEYDGSDELGFTYRDPDVAVPWPDPDPIVSERDATAPRLSELVAQLRESGSTT